VLQQAVEGVLGEIAGENHVFPLLADELSVATENGLQRLVSPLGGKDTQVGELAQGVLVVLRRNGMYKDPTELIPFVINDYLVGTLAHHPGIDLR